MAIKTFVERSISLLNRDYKGLRRDMITYGKAYTTGALSDYNETSAGMSLLEFAAYVGDGLNYYLDYQFNEAGMSAVELDNVQQNAKMLGYRPLGKRPAVGTLHWAIEVPATTDSTGRVVPDDAFTPMLMKGSQAVSKNGSIFETLDDVPFTASLGREVTGSAFDPVTGIPTHFAIRRKVDIVAGQTIEESFTITDFQQFRKIQLSQPDVIEVIDIIDSQGNEWLEVPFLAQDWVFVAQTNVNDDSDHVPYVMKLQSAPRRFIVDRDVATGISTLIFGSGDGLSYDDELVPNVAAYALPLAGRRTFSSFSIDPQNFLRTRSLGLSPHNTTLTVRYRVGGGSETNVGSRMIRQPSSVQLSFSSNGLDALKKARVEGSIGCINMDSTAGGGPPETVREIKANAAAFFAAQDRAVTREDIAARVLSIPSRFGRPEKVFVKTSIDSQFSYDVHLLTVDADGYLARASSTLKTNVATYLKKFKMLTDGVNLLDADIFDIRCNFGILVAPQRNRSEVISNCASVLANYFRLDAMQIGAPIIISDVIAQLQSVSGVVSVYELTFTNMFGTVDGLTYSDSRFNVSDSLRDGLLVCPPEAIFQLKYPLKNLVGSAR